MNPKRDLMRRLSIRSALLLCCSALIPNAQALAKEDSPLALYVNGAFVSADIRAVPLVEVARVLALKTGAAIEFLGPRAQAQTITAHFENLDLHAALRAILQNTNYTIVTKPSEQSATIEVYVYPRFSEAAARSQAPDVALQPAPTQPQNSIEAPPSNEFNPDPTVRLQELEASVASHGPQSLALLLAAAQDPDPLVQSASEQLLLNELRNVVPVETLSTLVLTSPRADIRLQALELVVERQDQHQARMTLDSALRDSDHQVQQRAKDLLLELAE